MTDQHDPTFDHIRQIGFEDVVSVILRSFIGFCVGWTIITVGVSSLVWKHSLSALVTGSLYLEFLPRATKMAILGGLIAPLIWDDVEKLLSGWENAE